jgi:hypothetical protein
MQSFGKKTRIDMSSRHTWLWETSLVSGKKWRKVQHNSSSAQKGFYCLINEKQEESDMGLLEDSLGRVGAN